MNANVEPRIIRKDAEYASIEQSPPESAVRRFRAMMAATCRDPRYSTPWGIMGIRGQLKDAHVEAVDWFIKILREFHSGLGAKGAKSATMEGGGQSEPPDPYSPEGIKIAKRERGAYIEYESARLAGLACGSKDWRPFIELIAKNPGPDYVLTHIERRALIVVSAALHAHHERGRRNAQRVKRTS